jgi:hypothetical protein
MTRRHAAAAAASASMSPVRSYRAFAVDLVAAGEVEPDAVGVGAAADVDGQLSLGAETPDPAAAS